MAIKITVFLPRREVLVHFGHGEKDEAAVRCHNEFVKAFGDLDFDMDFIAAEEPSKKNPITLNGVVAIRACSEGELDDFVRDSWIIHSDNPGVKVFAGMGAHRRDPVFRANYLDRLNANLWQPRPS